MAIKRKLADMLVPLPRDSENVHIHVPAADPDDEIVRGSEAFTNTVAALVRERNDLRRLNEQLNRKCVVLSKTNDRLEAEREQCKKQSLEYVRANGKLTAIFGGMRALFESGFDTMMMAQNIADLIPAEPTAPQPVAVYDQNGIPLDAAPEPTLADVESLSSVLARTD